MPSIAALVFCALLAASIGGVLDVGTADFSAVTLFDNFWGTEPMSRCTYDLSRKNCFFKTDDPWLVETLPMWRWQGDFTIPFTVNASVVRPLSPKVKINPDGKTYTPMPETDPVSRNNAGALVYNWTHIDDVLDGLISAGIKPSPFVLDNIPYALVAEENQFYCKFGMGALPDNMKEFSGFVEAMMLHLIHRYGGSEVNTWRFRLGTEADDCRMGGAWQGADGNGEDFQPRANGSLMSLSNGLDRYLEAYAAAGAAVKGVAPGAGFGPSNFACVLVQVGLGHHEHCTEQLNRFADEVKRRGLPIDFVALSEYGASEAGGVVEARGLTTPIAQMVNVARRAVLGKDAGAGPSPLPVEVQEFAWGSGVGATEELTNLGGLEIADGQPQPASGAKVVPSGAFGAAWTMATWLWQRDAGASKVFHWNFFLDSSLSRGDESAYPLVTSDGWAMAMMHSMLGEDGDAWGAHYVVDVPSLQGSYNNSFGVWRVAQPQTRQLSYLLVAYSASFREHTKADVSIHISDGDFLHAGLSPFWDLRDESAVEVTECVFNRSTSTHDIIRQELSMAEDNRTELLASKKPVVDQVEVMATAAGVAWAKQNQPRYNRLNKESLQSTPFGGSLRYDGDSKQLVLSARPMETPSVVLLTLRPVPNHIPDPASVSGSAGFAV